MSDSGITREEAEAMGLIDHDEEARRHAAAVEELTRLRNEREASSPASPSGNRHDGVRVYHDGGGWFRRMNAPSEVFEMYVARPVDIDAARTAVIVAWDAYVKAKAADPLDENPWPAIACFSLACAAMNHLDALTTKGATNA